jgi:hypothetical protein
MFCLGVNLLGKLPNTDHSFRDNSMQTKQDVRLEHYPPRDASDITVSIAGVTLICEASKLSEQEGILLQEMLPNFLLKYYLFKAQTANSPSTLQRDRKLKKFEEKLKGLQEELDDTPWLFGQLVAQKTQALFQSKNVLRTMQLRGEAEVEHSDKCRFVSINIIEEEFRNIKMLGKQIASLRKDSTWHQVADQRSKSGNANKPALDYLCRDLHILWCRKLDRKPIIGEMSPYFAFAKCIFELIGEARSDDTIIRRLHAAKKVIESLPTSLPTSR